MNLMRPSYFGALCARFLLGFVEAAFFPGALVRIFLSRMKQHTHLMLFPVPLVEMV